MEFLKRANVQLWNPFEVESLPLLAATFGRGYNRYPRRSLATPLVKRSFRTLYKLLRACPLSRLEQLASKFERA
jgi:hypothetical protein